MTLIWGSNFTVVKTALDEIPTLGFNTLRLLLASACFLVVITGQARGRARGAKRVPEGRSVGAEARPGARSTEHGARWPQLSRRDWAGVVGLALVGHFLYQLCFLGGLARTSVANSSLILSGTPVVVSLLTAALGHERVGRARWSGAAVSVLGIYLVAGRGASIAGDSLVGDLLMAGAVLGWAVYTVGSQPLLRRHSPLVVTGYSMALGTLLYAPFGLPDLVRLDWRGVSLGAWLAVVFSSVFALCVAYLIWYTAVQRLGNIRTSAYSNLVPVVAMTVAAVWLGERIAPLKILGACAILTGVALTRLETGLRSARL